MKVVIECLDGGEIVSDYCFKGWLGARNAGHEARLMSLSQLSMVKDRSSLKDVMPIGSIMYMTWFFNYVHNMAVPAPLKVHKIPRLFDLNWTEVDTKDKIPYPSFVKPLNDIKKFTGFVAKSIEDFDLYPELNGWDGPYFCCEPRRCNIDSEWRIFYHRGKIVNVSHYLGRPIVFPNELWGSAGDFTRIINDNIQSLPLAFTIDVGVDMEQDYTFPIELNDMWAIGPYGCPEDVYFKMLKDRWVEILKGEKI